MNSPRRQTARANGACPRGTEMFVVELIYKADLAQIDARMRAHMAFLKKHYASGHVPRSRAARFRATAASSWRSRKSREELEAIMREDPFCKHGLAEFRVIEFRASQRATDIPKRVEGA